MADLMTVLEQEDVTTREFVGDFTGTALTRANIEATLAGEPPFPRTVSFVISNKKNKWVVIYDEPNDEYWFELLTKAV
jgi:hypothetical protein